MHLTPSQPSPGPGPGEAATAIKTGKRHAKEPRNEIKLVRQGVEGGVRKREGKRSKALPLAMAFSGQV